MTDLVALEASVSHLLGADMRSSELAYDELSCEVPADKIVAIASQLRDDERTCFDQLIDLCGVDYSTYGAESGEAWQGARYAVVYHLQSVAHNHRIRLRAGLDEAFPAIDSVVDVWPVANWFEREAFDMYGILFQNHPDLRRILTDYGFIGHPFRKDFPLSGHVEMRYDPEKGRVIYEPVSIDERVLVPRSAR